MHQFQKKLLLSVWLRYKPLTIHACIEVALKAIVESNFTSFWVFSPIWLFTKKRANLCIKKKYKKFLHFCILIVKAEIYTLIINFPVNKIIKNMIGFAVFLSIIVSL